jgi:hypothetical protein
MRQTIGTCMVGLGLFFGFLCYGSTLSDMDDPTKDWIGTFWGITAGLFVVVGCVLSLIQTGRRI